MLTYRLAAMPAQLGVHRLGVRVANRGFPHTAISAARIHHRATFQRLDSRLVFGSRLGLCSPAHITPHLMLCDCCSETLISRVVFSPDTDKDIVWTSRVLFIVEHQTIMHRARNKVPMAYHLPSSRQLVSYCLRECTRSMRHRNANVRPHATVLQAVDMVQTRARRNSEGLMPSVAK